eukprot:11195398-Lingulodinium_polyedra.AAC.1
MKARMAVGLRSIGIECQGCGGCVVRLVQQRGRRTLEGRAEGAKRVEPLRSHHRSHGPATAGGGGQ